MLPLSPWRAALAMDARILQPGRERALTEVATDSRRLAPGAVFVAVKGRRDGESFFADALGAGQRSSSAAVSGPACAGKPAAAAPG